MRRSFVYVCYYDSMIEQALDRHWGSFNAPPDLEAAFPEYIKALLEFQGSELVPIGWSLVTLRVL